MIESGFGAMRVPLDALEDAPRRYLGQTVSVDGEVEDLLGPRLFTIDEPGWADPARELLVYMAEGTAALVREDDRVTITGTVKPFGAAVVQEAEWAWLDEDWLVDMTIAQPSVLVASRIAGGNDEFAMVVDLGRSPDGPIATLGASPALTDLAAIAGGDEALVGRRVDLAEAIVDSVAREGFVVRTTDGLVFVLPAHRDSRLFDPGDVLNISGFVLAVPETLTEGLALPDGTNDRVYVYATRIAS